MATRPSDIYRLPLTAVESHAGPVTTARQRRTLIVYAAVWFLGLLPALFGASPALQAAGLGLWMPGAGFVAVGGWAVLLFPLVLALFGMSLVAWFWAGMVIAPLTVWLGSAAIAGAMTGSTTWAGAHLFVALCMAATGFYVRTRAQRNRVRDEQKAERRRRFVPASLAEVEVRAAAVPDPSAREMTSDQLASLRYVLDRSLQSIDRIAQGAYTPNFQGYMHEAQRSAKEDREYFAAILRAADGFVFVVGAGEKGVDRFSLRFGRLGGETFVAIWHTHGAQGRHRELFSPADTALVAQMGVPFYLTDPYGSLRLFRPGDRAHVFKDRNSTTRPPYGAAAGTALLAAAAQ
jgi:hypothetical protein